jgi:hypothetical protein
MSVLLFLLSAWSEAALLCSFDNAALNALAFFC